MAANLNNVGGAGGFQTAVLIADGVLNYPGTTNGIAGVSTVANFTQITGGSPVVTVPIAAALEIQSIVGGLILPRMTTTQRNAMNKPNASINPTALGPGLMIYNTTSNTVDVYTGSGWTSLGSGGGGVTGPVSSTDKALAIWNGTGGNVLQNSTITLTTSGSDSILGSTPTNSTLALQANGTGLVAILATSGTSSNGSLSIQATDGSFFTMVAQTGTPVLNYLLPNTTPTLNQVLDVSNISGSNITLGWTANFSVVNVPSSVNFLQETTATTGNAPILAATGTDTDVPFEFTTKGNGAFGFLSSAGTAIQFVIEPVPSSVNAFIVTGAATGTAPTLGTFGSDTNIGANFATKGTGSHTFSTNGLSRTQFQVIDSAAPTTGWITVTGSATGLGGTVPTISVAGSATDIDIVLQTKGNAGVAIANSTRGGALALLNAAGTAACAITVDPAFVGEHNIRLPNAAPSENNDVLAATIVDSANTTLSWVQPAFFTASFDLTSGDILAISNTVSFPVLASPGPGKMLVPLLAVLRYNTPSSNAYTVPAGVHFILSIGGITLNVPLAAAGFIDQTVNEVVGQTLFAINTPFQVSTLANNPLVIGTDSASLFTGGTGDITIVVKYLVLDATGIGP